MATVADNQLDLWLTGRQWRQVRDALAPLSASDIASSLTAQRPAHRIFILKLLEPALAARVLALLAEPVQRQLLEEMADFEMLALLKIMPSDDRARLMSLLPDHQEQALLSALPLHMRRSLQTMRACSPGSVGRLLDTRVLLLRPDWSAHWALMEARRQAGQSGLMDQLFVVDEQRRLLGMLSLHSLVMADESASVADLMRAEPPCLTRNTPAIDAVRIVQHYDLVALPVLDDHGKLLGQVTVDDLLDVAEDADTASLHRLSGITALGSGLLHMAARRLYRHRIGWLLVLLVAGVAGSGLLAQYAPLLQNSLLIIAFLPLVIDCGGNAGAQAAIITVRALATGDVSQKDARWLLVQELRTALMLAATVAAAALLLGMFRGDMQLATVVGTTVFAVVLIGSILGVALPLMLRRAGLDPAIASAPLVSSLTDIIGIGIYLALLFHIHAGGGIGG